MKKINPSVPQQWKKSDCYFFSPHPDDAIFSCGDLIAELSKVTKVTIVTIFTKTDLPPYSQFAKNFLYRCGYQNATLLEKQRHFENKKAITLCNAESIELNYIDAAWRTHHRPLLHKCRFLSSILPQYFFLYPDPLRAIYPHKEDAPMIKALISELKSIIKDDTSIIFAPNALKHIDHLIIHDIAACFSADHQVIFWDDLPYKGVHDNHPSQKCVFTSQVPPRKSIKRKAIKIYSSQTSILPSLSNLHTERYFENIRPPTS